MIGDSLRFKCLHSSRVQKLTGQLPDNFDVFCTSLESSRNVCCTTLRKNGKQSQSFRELFGEGKINENRCREWFACFKSGDTSLEDKPGRGRKWDFVGQVQDFVAAIEVYESLTIRMLAVNFNVDHSAIIRRLRKLRKLCISGSTRPPIRCNQFEKIAQKEPIVFHHDNERPHVGSVVESIANKGWDLLPHLQYSPTEAPTDYYVKRSLKIGI
ncbi:hypothetical protein HNY73_018077 [Argiope bruennichi]|uniref:Mos1 transposase HTH domain-containing protein n=1 Tax=Argiope bruennichi TaxID=94029 RepID=A0A8T0ECW0_ARGBR|nr:hypothetical protein HNY73_018077 [Argiope bruennichi]